MASKTGICNSALAKIGAKRISSTTDENARARACNEAYDRILEATLRAHSWNFAIKRAQLAADVTGPLFDYTNSFTLPSDFIRLLPENDYGLDWIVEGKKIITNDGAPLNIRYIYLVMDPNEMDALFREVLACNIAAEICWRLMQSNSKLQLVREERQRLLAEARRTNAIEQLSQELPEDDWIAVRTSGYTGAAYRSFYPL
jgi:hypothetical protein